MIKVLRATVEDIDRVIPLAKMMHEESVYHSLPFEPEFVRRFAAHAVVDQTYCPLVAVDGSAIIGFFCGQISQTFFGPGLIASDHVFYVEPTHRGTSAAPRLLAEFEKWAFGLGAREIFLGITTGVHEDRTSEFYARSGYKLAGRVAKKEAK